MTRQVRYSWGVRAAGARVSDSVLRRRRRMFQLDAQTVRDPVDQTRRTRPKTVLVFMGRIIRVIPFT